MKYVQPLIRKTAWSMALSALMLAWLVVTLGPAQPANTQRTQPVFAEVVTAQADADGSLSGQPGPGHLPQKSYSVNWN